MKAQEAVLVKLPTTAKNLSGATAKEGQMKKTSPPTEYDQIQGGYEPGERLSQNSNSNDLLQAHGSIC
nr:unnamed protein product [Haemonchus contortus]